MVIPMTCTIHVNVLKVLPPILGVRTASFFLEIVDVDHYVDVCVPLFMCSCVCLCQCVVHVHACSCSGVCLCL